MTETSARFALPFILPGQAEKEIFHNEALALLDMAIHACVEGDPVDDPPLDPEPGQSWIVGPGATAAWIGKAGQLTCWTGFGWRFIAPLSGMAVWNIDAGYRLYWTGSGWSAGECPASALMIGGNQVVGPRLETVPSPSGGTIIDIEARSAVEAVIVALRTHGLIE
ncbi:MAG TPA: DUF2793 domain-containing protein [Allosphingosinicella sp.]|nr:DUF2793 domain-containing protein [Allosphingosinicella sp.]